MAKQTKAKKTVKRSGGRRSTKKAPKEEAAKFEERTCYVCQKAITKPAELQPLGDGTYRHKDCDPVDGEDQAKGKKAKPKKTRKPGLMDAAIQVMGETGEPMNCKDVVAKVLEQGLWTTNGKTPHATLYASILREIQKKGDDARFVKTERGKFSLKS